MISSSLRWTKRQKKSKIEDQQRIDFNDLPDDTKHGINTAKEEVDENYENSRL